MEAFLARASALVDRLQSVAVTLRDRASEAKRRARHLIATPTSSADARASIPKLKVLVRLLNARLRDVLDALTKARAITDAALVAYHRRGAVESASGSETTSSSIAVALVEAEDALEALSLDAEEEGLFGPVPVLPGGDGEEGVAAMATTTTTTREEEEEEEVGDAEMASLAAVAAPTFRGDDDDDDAAAASAAETRAADLRTAIAFLRARERDVDARAKLAAETAELSRAMSAMSPPGGSGEEREGETAASGGGGGGGGEKYTEENFAYGSTPLASWLRVIHGVPELRDALRELAAAAAARDDGFGVGRESGVGRETGVGEASDRAGRDVRNVVWGSSVGWLAFYAAIGLGVPTRGYELLRCHVATAREVASNLLRGRYDSVLGFTRGDMLTECEITNNTRVVTLTSQCWDAAVHDAAAKRLAAELAPGALVVDYNDRLGREAAFGDAIGVVETPTSWNRRQRMHVFRKRC